MENISAMATGKNALSTLHENILAMATGNIALSTLHENILAIAMEKRHCRKNVISSQLHIAHLHICTFGKMTNKASDL